MDIYKKLQQQVLQKKTYLCVGLDPDPEKIPSIFLKDPHGIETFLKLVMRITAPYCIAYKPNLSFFEALGIDGIKMLIKLKESCPNHIPWIIDAKKGDIGHTSKLQAKYIFEHLGADAVTLHPYMGSDSIMPFLDYKDRFSFVLALTSNPSANDFEKTPLQGGLPLYIKVAQTIQTWANHSNIGLVVGATQTQEIKILREAIPKLLFLMPGVGTQGADYFSAAQAGKNHEDLVIINASRQILYPSPSINLEADILKEIQKFIIYE